MASVTYKDNSSISCEPVGRYFFLDLEDAKPFDFSYLEVVSTIRECSRDFFDKLIYAEIVSNVAVVDNIFCQFRTAQVLESGLRSGAVSEKEREATGCNARVESAYHG